MNIFLFSLFSIFFSFTLVAHGQQEEGNTTIEENLESTNTTESNTTENPSNITDWFEETKSIDNQTDENNTKQNVTITEENQIISLICSADQCDTGCNICNDGSCHIPEESCKETVEIEKITPIIFNKGEEQLNIVLRNTGNVILRDLEAQVSGYGITTQEILPIETLPVGEKDYTFTKIFIEQSGAIDIVVKIYETQTLLTQEIFQITVEEDVIVEEKKEESLFNESVSVQQLNETRTTYNILEKEYYEKEKEGYILYGIDEDLDNIKEYLRVAQVAIIEEDQKEFEKNILAARSSMETIATALNTAEKQKKTIAEFLSGNLTIIGSILGVLISAITVWSMTKVHLKKAKIINIIKGKQILNVDKDTEVENIIEDEKE